MGTSHVSPRHHVQTAKRGGPLALFDVKRQRVTKIPTDCQHRNIAAYLYGRLNRSYPLKVILLVRERNDNCQFSQVSRIVGPRSVIKRAI